MHLLSNQWKMVRKKQKTPQSPQRRQPRRNVQSRYASEQKDNSTESENNSITGEGQVSQNDQVKVDIEVNDDETSEDAPKSNSPVIDDIDPRASKRSLHSNEEVSEGEPVCGKRDAATREDRNPCSGAGELKNDAILVANEPLGVDRSTIADFEFLTRIGEVSRSWVAGDKARDLFNDLKSVINELIKFTNKVYDNQLTLKKENAQLKKKIMLLEKDPLRDKKKLGFTRNTPYLNALEYEERRKKEASEISNAAKSLKCDAIPEISELPKNELPRKEKHEKLNVIKYFNEQIGAGLIKEDDIEKVTRLRKSLSSKNKSESPDVTIIRFKSNTLANQVKQKYDEQIVHKQANEHENVKKEVHKHFTPSQQLANAEAIKWVNERNARTMEKYQCGINDLVKIFIVKYVNNIPKIVKVFNSKFWGYATKDEYANNRDEVKSWRNHYIGLMRQRSFEINDPLNAEMQQFIKQESDRQINMLKSSKILNEEEDPFSGWITEELSRDRYKSKGNQATLKEAIAASGLPPPPSK